MEHTAQRIFSNTIGQTVLRGVEILIGVVTLGLITRYLGQAGFGQYTTINALLQLFIVIIDFGLYLTLLREISANPEDRTESITNNIFTMRLLSSAALLIIGIATVAFTSYPIEVKLGMVSLSAAYLFVSLTSTLTALFQKYLQMVKIAALNAFNKVLMLGMVFFVMWQNGGLQSILVGSSLVAAVTFTLLWILIAKLPGALRLRLRFDTAYWRVVITKAWPIALTTALNLIYFKADTVILSAYHSPEQVGLYGASYRVIEIMVTFPHMFMGLVLPVLTSAWVAKDLQLLDRIWQKAFLFFTIITLPLIAGTLILGIPVMTLVAGSEFAASGTILKILIFAACAIFFATLGNYLVLVAERQKYLIKFFLANAVLSLVAYFIFIPRFGYWGAAWTTVASEVFIVLGSWLVIRPVLKLTIPWNAVLKIAAASAGMALIALWLNPVLPLIPLIVVSMISYSLLIVALRAVTVQELKMLIKP